MERAPIIKDQHPARLHLELVAGLRVREQGVEALRRRIPRRELLPGLRCDARAVSVVPAHLCQEAALRIVFQYRLRRCRLQADPGVAARVRVDSRLREPQVRVLVFNVQRGGGSEAVDQRAAAAGAVGVGEQVQGLQASGFGEVSVVVVRLEAFGRVGSIFGRKVGSEVVEAACKSKDVSESSSIVFRMRLVGLP